MGLLEGKKALIFGVANDHSIAWGIARAFHAQGATVGFSSIESLIERRVKPLAESIGATFVEACDVQDDAQVEHVFERWQRVHGELDILVHALAFARREDLAGAFVDTSRDGFTTALDVSAYSLVALTRAALPLLTRRRLDPDAVLLRRREGRRQLQRDGRRQGGAGGVRPLSGRRPRPAGHPRQRHQRRTGAHALGVRHRAASEACTGSSGTWRRCGATSTSRMSAVPPSTCPATWRAAVTGEVHYVDAGSTCWGSRPPATDRSLATGPDVAPREREQGPSGTRKRPGGQRNARRNRRSLMIDR